MPLDTPVSAMTHDIMFKDYFITDLASFTALLAFTLFPGCSNNSTERDETLMSAPTHHLPLHLTSNQYAMLLNTVPLSPTPSRGDIHGDPKIDKILELGKRNLEWLELINQSQISNKAPASDLVLISSAATTHGISIDSPSEYGPDQIKFDYDKLVRRLPVSMKKVLLENEPFTPKVPLKYREFQKWSRAIDDLYTTAARWKILSGELEYYKYQRISDIRGYYFLSQLPDRIVKLDNFSSLSSEEQKEIGDWLVQLCIVGFDGKRGGNTGIDVRVEACKKELKAGLRNSLNQFYDKYLPGNKRRYERFFRIPSHAVRRDVYWTQDNSNTLWVPFLTPQEDRFQTFLSSNIEDEWKWKDWSLKLDFQDSPNSWNYPGSPGSPSSMITRLLFEPGTTPHVVGLGGSEIVMDANAPLFDYHVNWAIRHEFGHVLGFPDCYLEFYDQDRNVMISYQIELDNLMCSPEGHFKESHFNELKWHYFVD